MTRVPARAAGRGRTHGEARPGRYRAECFQGRQILACRWPLPCAWPGRAPVAERPTYARRVRTPRPARTPDLSDQLQLPRTTDRLVTVGRG